MSRRPSSHQPPPHRHTSHRQSPEDHRQSPEDLKEPPIPARGRVPSAPVVDASGRRPTIDRRSSGAQVAEHIRNLIFTGVLRQGDHVRQDEIAEELGVSRIPVREAIIVLDREGWVTNELHRGAFVHGLDEVSVRDHYGILGMLYGFAAARATERGSDEGISRLRTAERALYTAIEPSAVLDANEVFLRQIFALAQSSRLRAMSRLMVGIVPGNFFELVPGSVAPQKKGISAVYRAVKARDGASAEAAFVSLLEQHGERVVAMLRSRNILWTPDVPS